MFEDIHFTQVLKNISYKESEVYDVSDEDLSRVGLDAINQASFWVKGNISALAGYPMSQDNKDNYIYIQVFSYMYMRENYYTKRHGYDSLLILYTYSGKGMLEYKGCEYELKKGSCFVIDCLEEHNYYMVGDKWEHADLHVSGGNSKSIYNEYFDTGNAVFTIDVQDEFQYKLERILRYHGRLSPYRELMVHNSIQELLIFLLDNCRDNESLSVPEPIEQLVRYLNQNFADDISLDDMSGICGLSKYHLVREFNRFMHFTPHDYLNELRINHAQILLTDTQLPAYKVGILAGIPNEANFIRLFRLKTGITPGEYRKRMS